MKKKLSWFLYGGISVIWTDILSNQSLSVCVCVSCESCAVRAPALKTCGDGEDAAIL